jgi:hypothetical protein
MSRLRRCMLYLPSTVRRLGSHSIIQRSIKQSIKQSIERSIKQPKRIQNDSNNDIKNTEDIVLIIDNK